MPAPAVLRNFGVFVEPEFLDPGTREAFRAEFRSSRIAPAGVTSERQGRRLDQQARSTKQVNVSADTAERVHALMKELMPALDEHFGLELSACQEPSFLTYTEGDYFHPHKDADAAAEVEPEVRDRKVSAVVFVNGESPEPSEETYGGGSLVLYGLFGDERAADVGMPLNPRGGELVAFRSETVHEVQKVLHGQRHTIVSWFV